MIRDRRESEEAPEGISLYRSTRPRGGGDSDYVSICLAVSDQPTIWLTAYCSGPGEPIEWDAVAIDQGSRPDRRTLASGSLAPIPYNYYSDDPQPRWAHA